MSDTSNEELQQNSQTTGAVTSLYDGENEWTCEMFYCVNVTSYFSLAFYATRISPAPYSFRNSMRIRGQEPAFLLDESSRSSISSTDTDATGGYNDGLFVQLPPSPKTEMLLEDSISSISNIDL